MSGYGFAKANKAPQEKPADSPKTIDLSGLDLPPLEVSSGKREGSHRERRGLRLYEPRTCNGRTAKRAIYHCCQKAQESPTKSLYIQGPVTVLDRFIAYANETNSSAYWEVIDALLRERGR
jgi:hypothetical protein